MEGGGYYTEHSHSQHLFGALGTDWLAEAAAEVPPPLDTLPFVIADFGAAGGGNSLEPMRRALSARVGDAAAVVVHTDIPTNDFSALFELVEDAPNTYLNQPNIFALAAGRSFYHRLLPDRFLSVGWSSIAVHWLSTVSTPIPDHIYCSFAHGAIREALKSQSASDWHAFLNHRAHELRPSGRLVVVGGAALDDGTSGAEGLMDTANGALRALVHDGVVNQQEYRAMTIPTYNRTEAEFIAPFAARDFDDRLALRRHTQQSLPDPYFESYSRTGDLDRYVDGVAGFFRAAFEQSLWASLDSHRDPDDRQRVADCFRAELRLRIAQDPERVATRWHVVLMDIASI
jgi:hypothetical protein